MVDVGKVLVVGGGICGMSCAIQLANSGLQIDLIDLDPQWRVYGAGITITGPTFRALKEIGLIGEVIEKGFACDGAKTRTRDGALIAEVNMPGLAAGIPYGGGIMRPVLHEILARATKGAGVAVRLGLTIDHVADLGSSVDVVFSDGTADSYGLVVGADGINSKMRQLLFPDAPEPHFTGQGAWRVLAPRPPAVDMIETFLSPGIKAGVTPISDKQLYMFALSPETEDVIPPEDQAGRLKEVLEGFGGLIGDIRDHLGPESSIVYRPLKTVMMPAPWYRGRVVLVGGRRTRYHAPFGFRRRLRRGRRSCLGHGAAGAGPRGGCPRGVYGAAVRTLPPDREKVGGSRQDGTCGGAGRRAGTGL